MRAVTAACAAALVLAVAGTTAACGFCPTPRPADASDDARLSPSPSPSSGPLDPAAQRYLDAVAAKDADAVAAAFAADAVVVDVDVGREIRGRAAIRRWAADEVVGGVYTLLGHTPRTNGTTMLVRFQPGGTGGFRAAYSFDISDGLITRADLRYA